MYDIVLAEPLTVLSCLLALALFFLTTHCNTSHVSICGETDYIYTICITVATTGYIAWKITV